MRPTMHLTVATVIERDQHFLLVEEIIDGKKVLNQPAGHVEHNEGLIDAAVRETREETGYDNKITGFVGISTYFAPSAAITFYRNTFVAQLTSDTPTHPLDQDILGTQWMTLQEIQTCTRLRSPMVRRDIELYATGHIYPLSIVWEDTLVPAPKPPRLAH